MGMKNGNTVTFYKRVSASARTASESMRAVRSNVPPGKSVARKWMNTILFWGCDLVVGCKVCGRGSHRILESHSHEDGALDLRLARFLGSK